MARSRLTRRLERKTKKNFTLSILGIIFIFLFAFKFGIPLLINLTVFLSDSQNKDEISVQSPSFIAPPVLDSFPQATSSANIIISGIASKNQTIYLYINDDLVSTSKTNADGRFLFKETIKSGENIIKAKAIVSNAESEFSNNITTAFKNSLPPLTISSPSDGQTFSKDQSIAGIRGITDPNVKVTVNGYWAITDDNGNYSYNLPLQSGDNKIIIIATDIAGNKSEKEIKVNYSP